MTDNTNPNYLQAMIAGGMYGPNPYTQFPNGVTGTSYAGTPTDAMGRPIQAQPGMTLNQTPDQPQAPAATPAPTATPNAVNSLFYGMNPGGSGPGPAFSGGQGGGGGAAPSAMPTNTAPQVGGGQGLGASYQNALSMLSNPGKVNTPGATVPQSQPITGQPSVLNQFLANGPSSGGQPGAGGYSNQGFFDTLNKLKGMSGVGASS